MHLARLLEEAQGDSPDRRILWRDQIAPYGKRAIEGVEPWLTSGSLEPDGFIFPDSGSMAR